MAQKNRKKTKKTYRPLFLVGVAVVTVATILAFAILLVKCSRQSPADDSTAASEYEDMEPIELGQGLRISHVGTYAGLYMEDGTNDQVSDVMMVVLENTGEKDLQLARFSLKFKGFSADFEVTNLPAGASVVALERNRRSGAGVPDGAELSTAAFFPQSMNLMENTLKLTGQKGSVLVENISSVDISEDIWIYYKYGAGDSFHGGITFRLKLAGGLPAGQSAQIAAGHYDPERSTLICVALGNN